MIEYLKGDATYPLYPGTKIIAHICNDIGKWGKGFVLALSKRWDDSEKQYRFLKNYALGDVSFIQVEEDIYVANMIGQRGIRSVNNPVPIDYEAVNICLGKVAQEASKLNATVHMPRIGCGLAGGKWENIEPLITKNLCDKGIKVFVYDYD